MFLGKPHGTQAHLEFAQQMRHALVAGATPETHHPFTEYRSFDEAVPPKDFSEPRMAAKQITQELVRDHRDTRSHERAEVIVQSAQEKALKIRNVTRNIKSHDLPLAIGQKLVAGGEAVKDHAAFGRTIAILYDIGIRLDNPDIDGQVEDCLFILIGQIGDAFQLSQNDDMLWLLS